MEDASREGLAWDDNGLGPEPRWTREPDIKAVERVCRRQLGIPNDGPGSEFTVAFHADGAFNKLYRIQSSRGRFMLRVSLPVDPHNKTRGEAATLQLVRRITDIPVPAVVAFDDSRASEIGFEWLLMNMVPGTPAYYRWRIMSMEQKERLTARVADFQAQLFRCGNLGRGFRGIGTLGTSGALDRDGFPEPGQIVSAFFFSGKRYQYPIPRGPFRSSHDWYVFPSDWRPGRAWLTAMLRLRAHLNIIIRENTTAFAAARDEEARQSAEAALRVARKLLRMLHKLFPAIVNPPERTVLWHEELSLKNIMVDGEGGITGVIGWYARHSVSQVRSWHDRLIRRHTTF
jgi:aminoglycoside phosphotransferase (APT) family kinase protein